MEIIKNYLETMFADLPNTLEVKKAKDELYTMMEDKYTELINEGKPENEAIGIVISEFGNLDEIADDLGINKVVDELVVSDRRVVTQNEAENYIMASTQHTFFIALGVLLCIFSVVGPIIFSAIGDTLGVTSITAIGVALMFICVAGGVGLFVISSFLLKDWKFLNTELCTINYATADYIQREKNDNESYKGILLTVGIMLCIVSVIPVIVFDAIFGDSFIILTQGIAPALIFVAAGIGVFFIIVSGAKESAYSKLLSLNDITTVAGNYEPVKKERKIYVNKAAGVFAKEYWNTITCIYLIVSFLTFRWGTTWLIFPIASILRKPLVEMFEKKGEK